MVATGCGRVVALTLLLVLLVRPAAAVEFGPQGIVRQFCQADGLGDRVTPAGWSRVAPLVAWRLEPAWDHVVLITGYTVTSPRPSTDGALAVDVRYNVVGVLSALGMETGVHAEVVTFRVHAPEAGWRIIGPPPAPHIFANRVDMTIVTRSLAGGTRGFLANSMFVWEMLRSADWDVAYERTTDLLSGGGYSPVDRPAPGDLVVYLRQGTPYHVGFLEAEEQVVSSTLNAGIVRTVSDSFAGETKYLRLVAPEASAAGPQDAAPAVQTAVLPPSAGSRARAAATPRPTPRRHHITPRRTTARPGAQPSPTWRVK